MPKSSPLAKKVKDLPHNCIYLYSHWPTGKTRVVDNMCFLSREKCCGKATYCADRIPHHIEGAASFNMDSVHRVGMNNITRLMDGVFAKVQNDMQRGTKEYGKRFTRERRKEGHFHFIRRDPMSVAVCFIAMAHMVGHDRAKQMKFLDCGCGAGNIVLSALGAGFDAHGLEYDAKTLNKGKEIFSLFGQNPKRLFKGDLLKYRSFHKWDIIYGYCPLADHNMEVRFEARMAYQAKIGTYIAGMSPGRGEGGGYLSYNSKKQCLNRGDDRVRWKDLKETERVYFQQIRLGHNLNGMYNIYRKVAHVKVGST